MSIDFGALRMVANIAAGAPNSADTCRALLRCLYTPGLVVIAMVQSGGLLTKTLVERVAPDDLFLHTSSKRDTQLGESDSDCRTRLFQWPSTRKRVDYRVRRLDTLYSGRRRVCLIVITGQAQLLPAFSGAEQLLEGDFPPSILIDLSFVDDEDRVALLSEIGQRLPRWLWYDGKLLRVPTSKKRELLVKEFIETVFVLTPPDSRKLPNVSTVRDLALGGWHLPVKVERERKFTVRPNEFLQGQSLYQAETDGEHVWRWTGPGNAARINLPVPSGGRWRVFIEVFSWGVLEGSSDLRVGLQGERLRLPEWDGHQLMAGTVTLDAHTDALISLDLVCARMRPGTYEDPRRLGLCVSGFVLVDES